MSKRSGWVFLVMVPVGALAGLLLAAIVTFLIPRIFESEAIIEIKPRHGDVLAKEVRPEGVSPEEFVSPWVLGEIATLKSHDSLLDVIKRLELEKRWKVDEETALRELNEIVVAQSIRGSDLVAIRVRHTNKVDARDIANELARTYQAYRRETDQHDAEEMLNRLRKEIVNQADKVDERRKVLRVVARHTGNIYKGTDPSIRRMFAEDNQNSKTALQHFHQIEQEKIRLDNLMMYDADQLMFFATELELPDNIIPVLFPEYQEAKRELDKLLHNGLGDEHPKVKAKNGQIQEMKRQLDECVVKLRATLKAQLDLATKRLNSLSIIMKESSASHGTRWSDQDWIDVINDFETNLKLLQTLKLKLVGDETSLKLPRTGDDIHESPVITDSPVAPNVTLNLILGTLMGVLLSPLMAVGRNQGMLSAFRSQRDDRYANSRGAS